MTSFFSSFLFLVSLSFWRQTRMRQMVWIALGLLVFATGLVALNTATDRWGMGRWRSPQRGGHTFHEWVTELEAVSAARANPYVQLETAAPSLILEATRQVLNNTDFYVFSMFVVFSVFVSFLLPIWSLSFATEALGGERESRSLVWLLTRPIPRSAIYLAKFLALLPWSLGLTLGGFTLMCLVAGKPGRIALSLYWPAVLWGTLAFSALFHLMGACFRRAAVVGIVYTFFLETILGNMPGYMKRVSISFYTRCMMFEASQDYGVQPLKPSIYLHLDGASSQVVLMVLTVALLLVGMVVFSRSEYQDLT